MVTGAGMNCVALDYIDRSSQMRHGAQAPHLQAVPQSLV